MNKPGISQAAKSIAEVNKRLQELLNQVETLKSENINLKKALSDTRRELEQLKGQTGKSLKRVVRDVKIKTVNGKVKIKAIKYQDTDIAKRRDQEMRGMGPEERRQYWKDEVFIDQFISRLHAYFGAEWDYSWDNDVRRALRSMSVEEATYVIKFMGLDKMYYESDAAYGGEGSTEDLTAREIYNFIVLNAQSINPEFKTTGILDEIVDEE